MSDDRKKPSKSPAQELIEALKDWQPENEAEGTAPETETSPSPRAGSSGMVTLIEDPFQIPTLGIAEQQESTDELSLDDEDFEEEEEEEEDEDDEETDAISMSELRARLNHVEPEADLAAGEEVPTEADVLAVEGEKEEEEDRDETADLRTDPIEAEAELSRLEAAMAIESQKQVEALEELVPSADAEAQAAQLLLSQIAEDDALAAAEAAETESDEAQDAELKAALPSHPQPDENGDLDLSEMQSCLETLLFMTDKPMSLEKLQGLLGPEISFNLFQEAMTSLRDRYQGPSHGIELVEIAGGFQFRTKAGRAALAKKLAKVQTQRLSSGAMESLAIIAYRQPALKDDIDKVRGVDSSHFIRGLLDKKLIRISGRSELPGRPMLYSTTDDFLELFGMKDLNALPSLRELEQMVPGSQSRNPEDEDPRVREMRKLVGEMKANSQSILTYDPREDEQILQDIRVRVASISTTTPYLEEQKMLEKVQADAKAKGWPVPQSLIESHAYAEARAAATLAAQNGEPAPVVVPQTTEVLGASGPNGELPLPDPKKPEPKRYDRDEAAPEY